MLTNHYYAQNYASIMWPTLSTDYVVDHWFLMGGGGGVVQIPPKNIEHMLLVKKYLAEFLRREEISGSLNQGVAKDFAWSAWWPQNYLWVTWYGTGHHIFWCVIWYFASATPDLPIRFPIKVNPLIQKDIIIQRYSCIQIPTLTIVTCRYFCNKIRFTL